MGNRKIPLKDRAVVVQRLAEGKSTREAIKGTGIKSNHTAARIARGESHAIAQKRRKYLELIESVGAKQIDRAKMWAKMMRADKYIILDIHQGALMAIPDWRTRAVALAYIDGLAETAASPTVVNNNIQQTKIDIAFNQTPEAKPQLVKLVKHSQLELASD